ncbi:MAG: OmpA family protein [Chitinophagaceae bacterium]|nr:MAG: OmpA family protein [Chitinophagaceae bacterium]
MKKITLSLLAGLACTMAFAQNEYKKPATFGLSFTLTDFKSAAAIRSAGLSNYIKNDKPKLREMDGGVSVDYIQGLSNNLDFAVTLSGTYVNYPVPDRNLNKNGLLAEAAASVRLKLLSDKYYFNPYLNIGVGASKFRGYYGAFLPLGAGIQIKIVDDTYIMVNSQYRVPVTENTAYHFFHSIGVAQSFGRKPAPVVEVPVIPVVADRDGDGVIDADDKCPDVAGLASLQGCPDRDGDGIADGDDKCPDVAGLAKYGGCPIPDTDKDGINDEEDKCPTVPGVARYQGCPVPDTDGDGVNDEEDKCPTRQGPASNQGCPEIAKEVIEKVNYAAKNVFFATGSYKLLAKSNKSLNDVAALMKADESLMLDIDGHTDDVGTSESNQTLSENRAKAVKEYLVKQGVAETRLFSTGYGEDKPVADNKTAAGRAKNRRTEMTARNY